MRLFIDGIKTRQNIAEETHKKFGVKQLCEELGVSTEQVTRYIRQGYGDGEIVIDLIRKGIPFELSQEPVPCRVRREHTRGQPKKVQEVQVDDLSDIELTKAKWHLLNALKVECQRVIEQIDAIQQAEMYESIFGGKTK